MSDNGRFSYSDLIVPYLVKEGGIDSPLKLSNAFKPLIKLLKDKLHILRKLYLR